MYNKLSRQKVASGCVFWTKFELSLKKIRNQIFKTCPNDSVQHPWWLSKTKRSSLWFSSKDLLRNATGAEGESGGNSAPILPTSFSPPFWDISTQLA
jgi:hypothetical protein